MAPASPATGADNPLVTIITPAYNAARYITETVESVLAQGYPNLEYIVINDGSSDHTLDLLEPYKDRAKILSQENRGEQATVNRGVEEAAGEIVAVVNADDPIKPGLVKAAVEVLVSRPELSVVYPDWLKIDSQGQVIEKFKTQNYDYLIMIEQNYCIPGPGAFFRKAMFHGEPARNTTYRYAGDFEMWLRLGLAGPMQRLALPLATWRFHEAGGSQAGRNPEMAASRIEVMENLYKRPDLPPTVRARRRQAMSAAYYCAGVLAIHNPKIPGRRYLLKSISYKPIWPGGFIPMQRRSWLRMAYIFGHPLTAWAVKAVRALKGGEAAS